MSEVKILIVEDESLVALDLRLCLEALGYSILAIVDTGEDAIKKTEELKPDLILMDIVLPGKMDGIEATHQINSRFDIPVIYLTANSNQEILERAKATEPFGYMHKPFEERALHTTIEMAVYKHRMGKELKESENRFKSLEANVPGVVYRCANDPDWTMEYMSDAITSLSGYPVSDFIGNEVRSYASIIHPGDVEKVDRGVQEAVAQKSVFVLVYRILHRDGEVRHVFERGQGVFAEDGALRWLEGVIVDVTEHKRAQDELRKSETRLRTLANALPSGIFRTDEKGNCLYVNERWCELAGLTEEEARGEGWLRALHADDRERVFQEWRRAANEAVSFQSEYRFQRPDGKTFWLIGLAAPELDGNGKVTGYIGTVTDITQRKQAEKKLKMSNEELKKADTLLIRQEKLASIGTLSAGVCHEILNPLNIIGAIVQIMQMEDPPEEVKENYDEIMTQIKRTARITNNLRMFAHMKDPGMTAVDVHDLFDKTSTLIDYSLKLDNIRIERDYDENLPMIEADDNQLAQVFLNLLTNARDAMRGRENNLITIKTKALENGIEIRFSDNGPGIPEDIVNQIFDPFFTTKDPDKGTGLGLSMLYSIIEKHDGAIKVESREGEGATFIITLPPASSKKEG